MCRDRNASELKTKQKIKKKWEYLAENRASDIGNIGGQGPADMKQGDDDDFTGNSSAESYFTLTLDLLC